MVAPFRIGDRVAVPLAAPPPPAAAPPAVDSLELPAAGGAAALAAAASGGGDGGGGAWFEGVCESVSLRYTVLRSGKYKVRRSANAKEFKRA